MPSLFEARPSGAARPLTAAEQQELLQYARAAIVLAVCSGDLPGLLRHDGIFAQRCGVFVTLHLLQRLRGCIGVVETEESLGSSLVRCAASAALADPRFPPVSQEELAVLHIEISLLSTPAPIKPEQIEIGRHGLLVVSSRTRSYVDAERSEGSAFPSSAAPPSVSKGGSSVLGASVKRGLLLPQVAVEHHFTVEQFLAETCRKAGLPSDAWRNNAASSSNDNSAAPPFVCQGGSGMMVPQSANADRLTAPDRCYAASAEPCSIQLFAFTCQIFSEADTRPPES